MLNSFLADTIYLPEGLLEQFDMDYMCSFCRRETKEEGFIIQLMEKNILPIGYSSDFFRD